jgi:hypothetical protein
MCWLGEKADYKDLSGKEKESFNSAKLAAIMADYGYLECARINGDKWGADLLFYRASDADVKKVQLKGRVTFSKNYMRKDLYIAYPDADGWYMYPHDELVDQASAFSSWHETMSWFRPDGGFSWNVTPMWLQKLLRPWKIT